MSSSPWALYSQRQPSKRNFLLQTLKTAARRPFAGIKNKVKYRADRAAIFTLNALGLGDLLLGMPLSAASDGAFTSNFTLMRQAQTVDFGNPAHDPFLRSCQDIEGGRLDLSSIFVCEVPSARFFPENGLVYDRRWRAIVESVLDHRRWYSFRKTFRPRSWEKRFGTYSSIQHPFHFNNWHWMVDCLPQIRSLEKYMQGRPLTLLMSSEVGKIHREALECILPENFTIEYVQPDQWFELENFILPSYVSSRANAFMPPEYYDFIRENTFKRLGVQKPTSATGRYYISRDRAKHRRITNEDEVAGLLAEFGFEKILIEDYTFQQQVELFRNAEAIVSPHGAALGGIMYGEDLKVCVLYPEARPAGYFYTLARGLGHQHFCLNGNGQEDDDFHVEPDDLRRVLMEEMNIRMIV